MVSAYDPRAIANTLLDIANEDFEVGFTNLKLQKVLYFAHCKHLIEHSSPLISGHFEAWKYGPVNVPTYEAFKAAGASDITFRAQKYDIIADQYISIEKIADRKVIATLISIVSWAKNLSAGQLVDLSHAKGGPWDFIVNKARDSVTLGLRITDEVIKQRYKNQIIVMGGLNQHYAFGELVEETPIAGT